MGGVSGWLAGWANRIVGVSANRIAGAVFTAHRDAIIDHQSPTKLGASIAA